MTPPSSPLLFRPRWFPWLLLLVGLIIGYFVGKTSAAKARVLGDCIRRDSTSASINVTEGECTLNCPTCTWVRDD